LVGVITEKQLGEQAPPTHPLAPPSVSTGEMHIFRPKMSSCPAHWATAVQAPPVGVPPLVPPHWPVEHPFAPQDWHADPSSPQAWLELPGWQTPNRSQHPPHVPGPHAATAWHCC
jgi:hypothetical protein